MGAYKHLQMCEREGIPFDEIDTSYLVAAAAALGGEVVEGITICCPASGCGPADRSLTVKVYSNNQFFIYDMPGPSYAKAGAYAYVQDRLKIIPPSPQALAERIGKAKKIWSETVPFRGTLVET